MKNYVKNKIFHTIRFFKIPTLSLVDSGALVTAAMLANFFNFLYNAYLGRRIGFEEFGLISLISSFLNLSQIPLSAFSKTMTYRNAFLFGKYNSPVKAIWFYFRAKSYRISILISGLWVISIPFLQQFFNSDQVLPFLFMTPIWMIGVTAAVDSGFLTGTLRFRVLAIMTLSEVISKFIITFSMVELGFSHLIYMAVPSASILSFLIGWMAVKRTKIKEIKVEQEIVVHFPWKFYSNSILTKLSSVAFLNLDVLLAKHYLSPTQAGEYALLALVGKMIFFLGTLFSQFTIPIVSREEGAGRNSTKILNTLLLATGSVVFSGFIFIGLFGYITIPFLFGNKANAILPFVTMYVLGMACFGLSNVVVSYYQTKQIYIFSIASFVIALGTLAGIIISHDSVGQINMVMSIGGVISLLVMSIIHAFYKNIQPILMNVGDLTSLLFSKKDTKPKLKSRLDILIFNWRDTKHIWAGGAEVYAHELAKNWVKDGHHVTVFCGNDGRNIRNEVIDGVQIVRRGGFYTVYAWAFIYYLLRFRGRYHVVVDCENGIPFFTPLYVKVPVFLLIHHVHQHVFRSNVIKVRPVLLPMVWIATLLEQKVMPWLYQKHTIITISDSSRNDIVKLGLGNPEDIEIVTPGVNLESYQPQQKTKHPSFLYLGRLKTYKNIDIAIRAFAILISKFPSARLRIAGFGESLDQLKSLAKALNISHAVEFCGKVTEQQKSELLATSWVVLQPSAFEGWGLTVIEANASGTTVIASDVNGLKDSVVNGKTGILVPVGNIDALTKAMQQLVEDKEMLNTLSTDAVDWANNFSWHSSGEQFMKVIETRIWQNSESKKQGRLATVENFVYED